MVVFGLFSVLGCCWSCYGTVTDYSFYRQLASLKFAGCLEVNKVMNMFIKLKWPLRRQET